MGGFRPYRPPRRGLLLEAYQAGELAGRHGQPHTGNPYPEDSHEAAEWFDGWFEARFEARSAEVEKRRGVG
jgi:ribosome modulation factor